jgi:pilus assembly protein CpaF
LQERAVRQQIASAIVLVVQLARLSDGSRKVINMAEITGMDQEVISMQDIFTFVKRGIGPNGKVVGVFQPSRIRPKFLEAIRVSGIHLPQEMFERSREVR